MIKTRFLEFSLSTLIKGRLVAMNMPKVTKVPHIRKAKVISMLCRVVSSNEPREVGSIAVVSYMASLKTLQEAIRHFSDYKPVENS